MFSVLSGVKTFLLKLGSELQMLVKKIQNVLKIETKSRMNFHKLEYFRKWNAQWVGGQTEPNRPLMV